MFNRSLFHDLTITTFPLLLNYWKKFCEIRHQYVPKSTILKFRREHVINRKKWKTKLSGAKENHKLPLIDYCSSDRFSVEHVHISRSLGKFIRHFLCANLIDLFRWNCDGELLARSGIENDIAIKPMVIKSNPNPSRGCTRSDVEICFIVFGLNYLSHNST